MGVVCNGVCIRHKFTKSYHESNYQSGAKRCQICCVFLLWPTMCCPCCHMRLRLRPRNARF